MWYIESKGVECLDGLIMLEIVDVVGSSSLDSK